MKKLHGTGVALVTPMGKNGNIDFAGILKILSHTSLGADYYVVLGTTGESSTIKKSERKEIIRFVKENNPKNLPLVIGAGGNNTQDVIETLNNLDPSGLSAILSVVPYYNKPSQEGIYRHFISIAENSPLPIILYNVPGRTSCNINADTTLRLSRHPKIIGIKEASGNLEQCMKIVKNAPDFLMISGDDMLTVPILSIGGVGVISVLGNAFPLIFSKMIKAAKKGDYKTAAKAQLSISEISPLMYEEGNPSGIKQLLQEMGIIKNFARLPIVPPQKGLQARIRNALKKIRRG